MNVTIQISDAVYAKLLNGNTCVKGSIRSVNPTEGSFNAYEQKKADKHRTFMKLPHGRVSMDEKNVRLTLRIEHGDYLRPSDVMENEAMLACDYVDMMNETLNA